MQSYTVTLFYSATADAFIYMSFAAVIPPQLGPLPAHLWAPSAATQRQSLTSKNASASMSFTFSGFARAASAHGRWRTAYGRQLATHGRLNNSVDGLVANLRVHPTRG